MFYRGYVRTKDKKCIDKFKNDTPLFTLDQVKDLPEYAGIMAQDSILIDIDDEVQSEKLLSIVKDYELKCRVYKSRSGIHALFRNTQVEKCYTKVNLACGITADIKSGFKNSYEVLKIDGKEREVLYDTGDYGELPKFLYPVRCKTVFADLQPGDGRNQELFNYELILQSNDFSVEEAREAIRICNKYIFDEPLDDEELETILRDEAFGKPIFFKGTAFLFDAFARYLKSEHHICRINNMLHMYKDGIYITSREDIEHAMIEHIPQLSRNRRKEVYDYLDIMIRENTTVSSPNLIAFNNGIYDISTCEMIPFSPEYIITNKIPWDYNESAYCKETDEVLNNVSCNDKSVRQLLEEMVGYSLFRRNELGKAFILTGSGRNGKSTFLNMVKRMLGQVNISALDMKELGDRFSTIMIVNKLANIGDDISDNFLDDASEFKKITTGEMIGAEQKGQPKFQFEPYCKLMFSANSIPRIGKGRDSSAVLRRLIIVPFNARFTEDDKTYNAYIGDQLKTQESMEYLIQIALDGLVRVLDNQKFTTPTSVKKELEEFEVTNNPVLGFFHEIDKDEVEDRPTKDLYMYYQKYCNDNGLNEISNNEFSKQVKKYYNCDVVQKRVGNNRVRVFKGVE